MATFNERSMAEIVLLSDLVDGIISLNNSDECNDLYFKVYTKMPEFWHPHFSLDRICKTLTGFQQSMKTESKFNILAALVDRKERDHQEICMTMISKMRRKKLK